MNRIITTENEAAGPSALWVTAGNINNQQLQESGYANFKQTVALDYYTWVLVQKDKSLFYLLRILPRNSQVKDLVKNLPLQATLKSILRTCLVPKKHQYFTWAQSLAYNFLTYLLWEYAIRNDPHHLRDRLAEPLEGNPPRVFAKGKLISQDLANSMLEYSSIMGSVNQVSTIIELGAGSGRTAFVFLKLMPFVKYIIADIQPALAIAEKYLASQFPERRIFHYRPFDSYLDVKEELERADIIFLASDQLQLLPDKMADLFINISSFHEMRQDQVEYFFRLVAKLTRRYFYFKQWKVSKAYKKGWDVIKGEASYPVGKNWKKVYHRTCRVQTDLFEALYALQ
jgi:putative sugar O-methyltransferase